MTAFLSYFESGRFGDFLKAKAVQAWNWFTGKKPKVDQARLQALRKKYAKP